MKSHAFNFGFVFACYILSSAQIGSAQNAWRVHDRDRPNPPVVTPAATAGGAPSDAIVLFDGHSLDAFEGQQGQAASWHVGDGSFTVAPRSGSIQTKRVFGDCQIHVEWASPNPPQGEDQMRGNSGVIIMGLYELQVIDSYHARTYADGQAAAIYGQYPPLVNAARPPGEWQTYDIVFREPKFDKTGRLISRARETVIHNGVLVQDAVELSGPTAYHHRPPYIPLPGKLPLVLQDHGTPVRYRNIWIRELPAETEAIPSKSYVPLRPDSALYKSYEGTYRDTNMSLTVKAEQEELTAQVAMKSSRRANNITMQLTPISDDAFIGRGLPGMDLTNIYFTRDGQSAVKTMVAFFGGKYVELAKQ